MLRGLPPASCLQGGGAAAYRRGSFQPEIIAMLLSILFSLTSALPESVLPTDADTLRQISLDEVAVVSTPKETGSLRGQPAAVSLIGHEALLSQHINSVKGASTIVPNLFIPDYGSRITSAIYLRGVGSRINTPAVALYVDNIPYSDKSAYDFSFHDIERIDVLRGPQGTLYGRNAMGGIIRVYTKNPFIYQGTDLKLGYATGDNHRRVALTHYHRPSHRMAFSVGGYYEGGSGFYENVTTHSHADRMNAGGGRARAIFRASDAWKFDFTAYYDYNNERAYPYRYEGNLSATDPEPYPELVGSICNNRDNRYRRSLAGGGVSIEHSAEKWAMTAVTGTQFMTDKMLLDQDFLASDIYTLEQRQRLRTFSEEVIFRSRDHHPRWQGICGASFLWQNMRTTGPVTFYDDGLRWLEGNINSSMPDVKTMGFLGSMQFEQMSVSFDADRLLMGGTFKTPTVGAALFHQSNLTLAPRFTATLGLRLDYEHLRLDYQAPAVVDYSFDMPNGMNDKMSVHLDLQSRPAYDGRMSNDYLRLLPKLALRYQFRNDRGSIYASAAVGQRSGGYNLQMFGDLLQGALSVDMMRGIRAGVVQYLRDLTESLPNIPQAIPDPENPGEYIPLPDYVDRTMEQNMPKFSTPDIAQLTFKPEYSWNYELGVHLDFLSGRLAADAAVFYVDTRNQQIARFADSGLGRMMVNAGHSRSAGAEASVGYRPTRHIALTASYGFTHAIFKEYDGGRDEDYSGNFVPFVPRHTLHADAAYTWFFARRLFSSLTLGANVSGAGRIYWTEDNAHTEDFTPILGARLVAQMGKLKVQAWLKNLTDARYATFYFESAGRGFAQQAKPLQFGLDVNVNF